MEAKIFSAIQAGLIETIRKLILLKTINLNCKNSKNKTLLHVAIENKNVEIVKLLIDNGADFNVHFDALNAAYALRDLKVKNSIVKTLIMAGAEVNKVNKCLVPKTALHVAVCDGDVDLVHFLINHGADVNKKDSSIFQRTPLHFAAKYLRSENPFIFELLLSANADVNAKAVHKQTPLHFICDSEPKINSNGRLLSFCKIFNVLKKYGADFNAVDENGCTPMHLAINNKNLKAVKGLVLCGGVNVDTYLENHSNGRTILFRACLHQDFPTVKFLLKNGANINILDCDNKSILHSVIDSIFDIYYRFKTYPENMMKILKFLLKFNPDVNTVSRYKRNILSYTPVFSELPDFLWQIIIDHLALLYSIKKNSIHAHLLETIFHNFKYKDYFEMCLRELELAKNNKLPLDGRFTFYDLLVSDERKIVKYVSSFVDLKEKYCCTYFTEKFKIYSDLMHNIFLSLIRYRIFLEKTAIKLSDLLPINVDPTHVVVNKILNLLSLEDMRKLQ